MTESVAPPTDLIVVLGLPESGAGVIGEILTAAGIERAVPGRAVPRPGGPCHWVHDPSLVFGISDEPPYDHALLILADHDEHAVAEALAKRFDVEDAVARATWQTHRGKAQQVLLAHRHFAVDAAAFATDPSGAVSAITAKLREAGVAVDPAGLARSDDVVRAILAFKKQMAGPASEVRRNPAPGQTAERLDHIESTLRRHETDILRSTRRIASLNRQLKSHEDHAPAPIEDAPAAVDAGALPQLQPAEHERGELMEIVEMFARESRALIGSKRWRVGDRLVGALSPRLRHRHDELASARLLRLAERFDRLESRPITALRTAQEPMMQASAVAESSEFIAWDMPEPRRYDVIVLANVFWKSRQQRPHHLARTFARHGHRVFYVSIGAGRLGDEETVEDGVLEVEFAPTSGYDRYSTVPGDEVIAEWMVEMEALRLRHGIDDAAVHVQLQSWTPLAWHLRDAYGWRIVYDCMDEWENFPGMAHELLAAERELVAGADLVVTTAERLRRKWVSRNPNTLLVRNGVDVEFFVENCLPSGVLAEIRHPVIGFTGALASWVDFELVAAVARDRPDWTFVLVGDVFVEPNALFGLDEMENVVMTGLQPFPSMPRYLFWFDAAIIPFVVDQISAAVDPVKFYEYAASGTPIVTTPLPELSDHHRLFYEATDPHTFQLEVERALVEDPALRSERVALAQANTWDERYIELDRATAALWPTVSVIIVTYGQLAHTRRCLASVIRKTSHPTLEVIVVDNGSRDGTPNYLRRLAEHDHRITVILNDDNLGFAAANNQGLETATGDVLILLNNDTEVSPGWHIPLLEHLGDPTIGLVGPRSDNVGNSARIDVPPRFVGDLDGFSRSLRRLHEGELFDIRMLGMFCVAMRADVFKAIGPLDEGYGVGLFEDDDYAERIRAAGWRVACARDAFVHHVGQATFRSLIDTGEYDELWARNRARFESRWGQWRAQNLFEADIVD